MESCDTVCSRNDLNCSESEFALHNNEVDSSKEVLKLIEKLGGETSVESCASGSYAAVPLFNKDSFCMYSDKGRKYRPHTFDCTKVAGPPDQKKQRLCYCHKSTGIQNIKCIICQPKKNSTQFGVPINNVIIFQIHVTQIHA